MSLKIDSSKDEVVNLLKDKFKLGEKVLSNIINEEIDGEALTLLIKNDYKFLGISTLIRKKIKSIIEVDILKITDNIKQSRTYKYIYGEDLNNLWNSLDKFLEGAKLGEKLKFLKYLLERDPPPEKEKTDDLSKYFKRIFKNEENVKQIIENLEDLLPINKEEDFEDQCSEWKFSDIDIIKLKVILELMKQNKSKLISENLLTTQNEKNKLNEKEEQTKIINEKNEVSLNPFGLELINGSNSLDDKYVIYSAIKAFKYETSQEEITMGLINPIEEFEKICYDFKIKFENECSFIDYNKAKEIKLTSFMLWGSKKSLIHFFEYNNIKVALDYFSLNENKNKTGIYICINLNKNIAFLIIWPGNLGYQYSKLDEPNDNILLTLVRYGFSLSSNSIICLSKNEVDKFNFEGYELFEDMGTSGFEAERRKYQTNEIKEKVFNLGNKLMLLDGLKENFNEKKIISGKINQNSILLYEEKGDGKSIDKQKKNIFEFIKLFSKYDLNFDDNFYIDYQYFYLLIRKNPCYLSNKNENNVLYIKSYLDDVIEEKLNKKINELFKRMNNELFDINKYEKEIRCKYCPKNQEKKLEELYYIKENKNSFFHISCYNNNKKKMNVSLLKLDKNEYITYKKFKFYQELKQSIIKKCGILKDLIDEFFNNCESKFKSLSYLGYWASLINLRENILIVNQAVIQEEIQKLRISAKDSILSNEKKKKDLIGTEIKKEKEFYKLAPNIKNNKYNVWMNYWKETINNYYKNNSKNIMKWVTLKSYDIIYKDNNNKTSDISLLYELNEITSKKEVTNLYFIKPIQDSSEFNLIFSKELSESNRIENYIPYQKKGCIVYKNGDNIKIKFNEKKIEEFNGLYDFDNISGTLALFKEENYEKIIGIYYSNGESKTIYCNNFISEQSKVNKIMLIPCVPGYDKQSLLLFLDEEIQIFELKDNSIYPKNIILSTEFNYINFDEFQFIVYLDFLLILKFDKETNNWNGKLFSLCQEDESLFQMIKEIKLENMYSNTKFSFCEIKDKKYLFSITILENTPLINYWKVDSKLTGISTEYQIKGKKKNIESKKIPYGNCVVNYFYHCFEKYPLVGAIQYYFKKYEKKHLKIGFFVEKDYINRIHDLESYLNELKVICEKKKKIFFGDVNLSLFDIYKNNLERNETSLGNLLINLLTVTPIQIAKIMGNEFKIMSNGESIEKKISIETAKRNIQNKETKINLIDYSNMINFCIKDSIFNFFELPVIVICCFGKQSIGKSTFLNELTGSLFNVSGMRCTEGIWMSIKLFVHSIENKNIDCKNICKYCGKAQCCLLMHEMGRKGINCICQNCKCDKDCLLKKNNNYNSKIINCDIKCCLNKNHEELIKCSFEGCECKCLCDCICEKNGNNHQHFCFECQKENRSICECDCNCKHFCKIPILLHNFICVCLDFEGLILLFLSDIILQISLNSFPFKFDLTLHFIRPKV